MLPILIVHSQSSNHWLLYFICQNPNQKDFLQQEGFFSFSHIVYLCILPVIYGYILYANVSATGHYWSLR